MAENADGQEKSEEPTSKKLEDARKKGQVARSKELATMLIMMIASLWLLWLGPQMMVDFERMMIIGFSLERDHAFDMKRAADLIFAQFEAALWLIFPFVMGMMVMAIVANILVGGWLFSTEVMAPKFSKLNPIAGIKRMFSLHALVELIKALLKFFLMAVLAILFIYSTLREVYHLGLIEVEPGLASAGEILAMALVVMSLGLIVIAVIDVPYMIWKHNEDMKMTLQEVKDEFKQTEGNPEIKGRIRRMQQEMAMRRMMQDVPTADVIITNPEHYAVALKYDGEKMNAPVVLAMGMDFMAAQIRTIATQNNVEIVRSPALARALYYNSEVGQVIPRQLFVAVAQILAMVFQLKERKINQLPDFDDVVVPAELKQSP
ncbi:MAG: flagellar biosynthesis protein FlhB [Gammaproteobacteria bacterium]|nr:flagellar biosynthesis protein FlhB [Gammaproteobacteria bacterium]OYZ08065.1 MAG: flagellar biosynthesis protein FlhB [Thiotrichales bacterium 16-46-22]HQT01910.1 flagellar biosynthesis protein FlhB [Thiotrichales bacterium]HQT04152.1 flagellar biosynthesis protein FlhB [Thiotrichales bacterium]